MNAIVRNTNCNNAKNINYYACMGREIKCWLTIKTLMQQFKYNYATMQNRNKYA